MPPACSHAAQGEVPDPAQRGSFSLGGASFMIAAALRRPAADGSCDATSSSTTSTAPGFLGAFAGDMRRSRASFASGAGAREADASHFGSPDGAGDAVDEAVLAGGAGAGSREGQPASTRRIAAEGARMAAL